MIPAPGNIVSLVHLDGRPPLVGVVVTANANSIDLVELNGSGHTIPVYPAATRPKKLLEIVVHGNDNKLAALLRAQLYDQDELSHAEREHIRKQFTRYNAIARRAVGLPV